jgi:hypothetical protein
LAAARFGQGAENGVIVVHVDKQLCGCLLICNFEVACQGG